MYAQTTLDLIYEAHARLQAQADAQTCPVHVATTVGDGLACSMCVLDSIIRTLAQDRRPARRQRKA
jgi:hypothetical protein